MDFQETDAAHNRRTGVYNFISRVAHFISLRLTNEQQQASQPAGE
jgi:hypothetical protein